MLVEDFRTCVTPRRHVIFRGSVVQSFLDSAAADGVRRPRRRTFRGGVVRIRLARLGVSVVGTLLRVDTGSCEPVTDTLERRLPEPPFSTGKERRSSVVVGCLFSMVFDIILQHFVDVFADCYFTLAVVFVFERRSSLRPVRDDDVRGAVVVFDISHVDAP